MSFIQLFQNESFYVINTVKSTHTTMTANGTAGNGLGGWQVYGVTSISGTISLIDGGSSANNSFGEPIPYTNITSPPVYVAASAETDAVVKYVENATALLPSTTYYFTLTQLNPNTKQEITNTIYFTTSATPSTPVAGTVAAGLEAVLKLTPGYNVTLSIATTTNSNDTLVITANAGFPILSVGSVDVYAASFGVTTTGVVSNGYPADMASRGFNTLPGYTSANNYDELTVNYNVFDPSNGNPVAMTATVFINHGDSHASAQKAFLGGATSFFAGYDFYYAIVNTTMSSTTLSKQ